MTWREDLRRVNFNGRQLVGASFRGVPFFVEESERSGGRRIVVHKFPLRADPFVEDLDRDAREFRITGYVIGDDYMVQRDALLTALEDTAGPGELVHPYYGTKRAICGPGLSVRETRADGGMATFSIPFTEAPTQQPVPVAIPDPSGKVATAAGAARAATKTELVEKFSAAGLPAFALASAETAIKNAAATLDAKLGPITSTAQQLAELSGRVALITAEASALARSPASAVDAFTGALDALGDASAAAPGAFVDALLDAYGADLGALAEATTTTRQREAANQVALTGALRRIIAIEAARLAPTVTYTTIEDATAARDRISDALDEQAAGADTAYPALVALRSEVLRAVPGGAALASVTTTTRAAAVPSLLLAYQLYGSVEREADIIARNGVSHPGFISGELKVLSK